MSLDLGHICQATDREPEKLSTKSLRYALANTGFTHTRRPNKTKNFALYRSTKLSYGHKLENSVFHVFEAIMILVENFDGVRNIVILRSMYTPRYLSKPVYVISSDTERKSATGERPLLGGGYSLKFARSWFEMNKFVQLFVKYLSHTFRHSQLACFLLESFHELVLSITLHTQLFFDAFELLHQVILSLSFLYFGVYITGDLKLKLSIDEFFFEKHESTLEAIFNRS